MSGARVVLVGVLGVVASAVGVVLLIRDRATFGWTAYAPLSSLTYTPSVVPFWPAVLLTVIGAAAAGACGALFVAGSRILAAEAD